MIHPAQTTGTIVGGLLLLLPLYTMAAEIHGLGVNRDLNRPIATTDSTSRPDREPQTLRGTDRTASELTSPVYNPPRRGATAQTLRVGGGTRGPIVQPTISVLAPNEHGVTTVNQPTLYWFSSGPLTTQVLFTLIKSDAVSPTLVARLEAPETQGIHPIRLADLGIRLEPGETYEWSVAVVGNHLRRSHDVVAMGEIEFVPAALPINQQAQGYLDYAQQGLWYDAVMALSDLLGTSPTNATLRSHRAALTDAVGLDLVATYDRNMGM